jgi:hypothetical protein
MRCRRCESNHPRGGLFCIGCGIPLGLSAQVAGLTRFGRPSDVNDS